LKNQLLVCSHHQANPKNTKRRKTVAALVGDLRPYNIYYMYITMNKSGFKKNKIPYPWIIVPAYQLYY
jgi:hypothetical protein